MKETERLKYIRIRNNGSHKVYGKSYYELNEKQQNHITELMERKYPDVKYKKLTNLEKCSFLQRKIILHSILYYEMNKTIISDVEFDKLGKKLLEGIKHTPDYEWSDYYYVFYDFDGHTGFDLYHRLNKHDKKYLTHIANKIYEMSKNKKEKK